MNVKRFILASLAVFVASQIIEFLIHGVMLRDTYETLKHLWRPDMESKMWIMWLVGFLIAFPFTYLFIKGWAGKGIMEGLRFGFVIGLYTSIPMAYGTYAIIDIPYSLAVTWLWTGIFEATILGAVAALVYGPPARAAGMRPAAA
jgi:uncharacterized PurR-regulated membrane protein YhhQ (DUF165 family)